MFSFGLSVFYVLIYNVYNALQRLVYILDLFFYTLGVFLLVFLHGKITYVARKHQNRIAALETSTGEAQSGTSTRKTHRRILDRASKMMIGVVGVYLLLGLPFEVADIILLSPWADRYYIPTLYLTQYGAILMTFNSSVNFFIYAALNKRFNYAYKLLLTDKASESNMSAFSATQFA